MKEEMAKKGLSDVITTVLIIVLALAAVAIIGAVVMNNVRKAGGTADALSVCQNINLAYSGCSIDAAGALTVKITQNSDVKPNKLYAIWYGSNGAALGSSASSKYTLSGTLQRYVSFQVPSSSPGGPVATMPAATVSSVSTAKFVHVVTVDGKDYDCPVPTLAVSCGGGAPACTPETDTAFCTRNGNRNCGSYTGTDNCGSSRTVDCGSCTVASQTCGGGGTPNVCGSGTVPNVQPVASIILVSDGQHIYDNPEQGSQLQVTDDTMIVVNVSGRDSDGSISAIEIQRQGEGDGAYQDVTTCDSLSQPVGRIRSVRCELYDPIDFVGQGGYFFFRARVKDNSGAYSPYTNDIYLVEAPAVPTFTLSIISSDCATGSRLTTNDGKIDCQKSAAGMTGSCSAIYTQDSVFDLILRNPAGAPIGPASCSGEWMESGGNIILDNTGAQCDSSESSCRIIMQKDLPVVITN